VAPGVAGSDFAFESEVPAGRLAKEFVHGVEVGLASAKESGVVAGFPVIDCAVTLLDGAAHDVDSSAQAFEIAAGAAFREGMRRAGPVLLEPVMRVEVVTPEDYMGDIIGDLNASRSNLGDGAACERPHHRCDGAARQHVRIRQHAPLDESGACAVQHAIRSLRPRSPGYRRRGSGKAGVSFNGLLEFTSH
jgi:translation elongation factor EF-G